MKPRADSKLKTLPEDQQAQVFDWCAQDGYEAARQRCSAELGLSVSLRALSEFWHWFSLRRSFSAAEQAATAAQELMLEFDPVSAERAAAFGQFVFTQRAISASNSQEYAMLEGLRLDKETAKFKGEIEREKLEVAKKRLHFMTCAKFLEWFKDERARQIADGSGTNSQKIEALGQAMFGEDW